MICDECVNCRGMQGGMVRCWNRNLMLLTLTPVSSMRRKKVCPRKAVRRTVVPEGPARSMDMRTIITRDAGKAMEERDRQS